MIIFGIFNFSVLIFGAVYYYEHQRLYVYCEVNLSQFPCFWWSTLDRLIFLCELFIPWFFLTTKKVFFRLLWYSVYTCDYNFLLVYLRGLFVPFIVLITNFDFFIYHELWLWYNFELLCLSVWIVYIIYYCDINFWSLLLFVRYLYHIICSCNGQLWLIYFVCVDHFYRF